MGRGRREGLALCLLSLTTGIETLGNPRNQLLRPLSKGGGHLMQMTWAGGGPWERVRGSCRPQGLLRAGQPRQDDTPHAFPESLLEMGIVDLFALGTREEATEVVGRGGNEAGGYVLEQAEDEPREQEQRQVEGWGGRGSSRSPQEL